MSATIRRRSSSLGVATSKPPRFGTANSTRLRLRQRLAGLGQDLTAVDDKRLTSDVTGFVGGEEQRGVSDIGDAAESTSGNRRSHLVHVFLAHFDEALGDDVA